MNLIPQKTILPLLSYKLTLISYFLVHKLTFISQYQSMGVHLFPSTNEWVCTSFLVYRGTHQENNELLSNSIRHYYSQKNISKRTLYSGKIQLLYSRKNFTQLPKRLQIAIELKPAGFHAIQEKTLQLLMHSSHRPGFLAMCTKFSIKTLYTIFQMLFFYFQFPSNTRE